MSEIERLHRIARTMIGDRIAVVKREPVPLIVSALGKRTEELRILSEAFNGCASGVVCTEIRKLIAEAFSRPSEGA